MNRSFLDFERLYTTDDSGVTGEAAVLFLVGTKKALAGRAFWAGLL